MTTLEEFILINTLHQRQSVWGGGGGGKGQMGKMYTATCLAVSIDSKSKIIFQVEQRLLSGIPKPRVSDPHKKSLQKV